MQTTARELADFFDDSFRALKPDKLSASILDLCREIVGKSAKDEEPMETQALLAPNLPSTGRGELAANEENDLVGAAANEATRWGKP